MLVEAYGEHALGKTQCFEWFKKFKSGNFDVRNEERGKPPKKFADNELQALLDEDDTQTQQELADQLNVTQKAISIRLKTMGKIQKKVGCDLRVGSNKNTDVCGVCGGNGSSCQSRYSWSLESISACSKSCGGGFKIGMAVCKSVDESVVEDSYCDANNRPSVKSLMPCNTHPCTTKWMNGDWSACSASCGGGSRTRSVFCTEENGNETTKLPDHKCSSTHKPHIQETCNTVSCPMWETDKWSECSVTCGTGIRTRTIECKDGVGAISRDCDLAERPHTEQECKTNVACPTYGDGMSQPLVQPYPLSPMSEKLMDQPIPSESTFIAEEWSPCSVTCGEGVRHREVRCKIFLEFSQTIAKLPDSQCSGPKPVETEKCTMEPCGLLENSLSYRIDTVGDSGYAESSLTDSYSRSSSGSSGGSGYDSSIKVAPGSDVQTTYSWKETGYTPCSATCLGGNGSNNYPV
ncbi:PREDICTED: A disintegrin and metalloproteinase with thrombospondin motifs 9-like [Trachymyrmex cornetzi]|nr:PREDICTED: A disintegrin and metalloproteinase with thrombospondin motifs 9-like [Trachymyrmex cornetzi]